MSSAKCQPFYLNLNMVIGNGLFWVHSLKDDLIVNTLRPRQNGCHFADDIFKYIFLNENGWIVVKISLQFVPKGSINNISALV